MKCNCQAAICQQVALKGAWPDRQLLFGIVVVVCANVCFLTLCVEESNISRCGFSVESFLTFFHCQSALLSWIHLLFFYKCLFFSSKTRIRPLLNQILHIKCQRVLERTTESRALHYYQEKSIKSGAQGTLNTNQRHISEPWAADMQRFNSALSGR